MNYKKISILAVASALTMGSLALTPFAHASTALDNAKTNMQAASGDVGNQNAPDAANLPKLVSQLVNVILGVLGMLLFVYFFYAGFLWMTAGGEAEKIKKAKGILVNSTIGLVIVLASYAISSYVLTNLINATTAT